MNIVILKNLKLKDINSKAIYYNEVNKEINIFWV